MRAQSGRVTQRCHNSPRWGTGWLSANDVTHRKRAEVFGRFRRKGVEARRRTRRFDFRGSQRRDEFARYGRRARWGPDEEANIKRLCLSPYVEEPLTSKVIKGSYLNLEVVTCFSYFKILCSKFSICGHEHSMYISHIAVSGYGTNRLVWLFNCV